MKIDITQEDFGILAICAIRYCQGRKSYMPSLVQQIIKKHLNELSDNDINRMLNDCEFQKQFNLYGDEKIDKPDWLKWEKVLKEEKERRKNDYSKL